MEESNGLRCRQTIAPSEKGERYRWVIRAFLPLPRILVLTARVLDKSVCQMVTLPSDERHVTIYFDEGTRKATTEGTAESIRGEGNSILTTMFLDRLRVIYRLQRLLCRLDMSVVYVVNTRP